MKLHYQKRLIAIFAPLMLMMLCGCATSSNKLQPVSIPPAPEKLFEKTTPPIINTGDNAKIVAARALSALSQANSKLEAASQWYAGIRKNYTGDEKQ